MSRKSPRPGHDREHTDASLSGPAGVRTRQTAGMAIARDGMTGRRPVGRGPGWGFPSPEGLGSLSWPREFRPCPLTTSTAATRHRPLRPGRRGIRDRPQCRARRRAPQGTAAVPRARQADRRHRQERSPHPARQRRRRHRQGPRVGQRAGHRRQGPRPRPGQRRRAVPDGRRSITPNGRPTSLPGCAGRQRITALCTLPSRDGPRRPPDSAPY